MRATLHAAERGHRAAQRPPLEPARLRLGDVVDEALAGIWARPLRSTLTALGVALGIASLVAVVGISSSAGTQIVAELNQLLATTVVIEPERGPSGQPLARLAWGADERVERLNGVASAGTRTSVDVGGARARTSPVVDPAGPTTFDVPVVAVSAGLFSVVDARLSHGRTFDEGHDRRGDPVAVLGPAAAQRLGITAVDRQPVVFVGRDALTVVGVLDVDGVERLPSLLSAIVVPNGAARALWRVEAPESVVAATALGASRQVADEARLALAPDDPSSLAAAAALDPQAARDRVAGDVTSLFVLLGAVSLLVGAVGIANVTLVSVMERVPEIGLRRALGGRRHHIGWQFLLESSLLGLLGGLVGSSLGAVTTVAVSIARGWVPVLHPLVLIAAPLLGALVGLGAGLYPAHRAANVEPITALRAS